MNKKKPVMAFVLIYGIGVFLYFYITGRKYQKIYSQYLEEKRLFRVHLPEGYGESQERYPVFYLLDANYSTYFSRAAGILDKLGGNQVPKMILVGILNTNCDRDMLPTGSEHTIFGGGADKFLKFITRELIPFIDKKYRTGDFRVLYIIYGEHDPPLVTTAVQSFVKQLREANPEGFRWEANMKKREGHIPVSSQYNGLKFIFFAWKSPGR